MTTTAGTWDAPTQTRLRTAAPGQDRLVASLRAIRGVCDAAIPATQRGPGFDPASGWQTADGLLGLLEATLGIPVEDELLVPTPPTPAAAATTVERLFRVAADATLATTEALRGRGATNDLLTLATVMNQLAEGYQRTFGRPW
jgi:hypothetical protein